MLRGMITHPLHVLLRGIHNHSIQAIDADHDNLSNMLRGMITHPLHVLLKGMPTPKSDHVLFDEKKALVKLSCVKQTKRVVGKRYFFVADSLHDQWYLQCISSKRVVPSHVHKYVAVECNSYQTTNRQMKGMLMMIGIQQRFPPKKRATNKCSAMWKLFVVGKLTQYKMEGFYVDSHGSLHHGELEHILCFKGMIFTAINLWSAYMLPMVSNFATYNMHDGGLDAQLALSVVRFNTIQKC